MNDDSDNKLIQVRQYGRTGPVVVLLHGGPGAAGYMAPVARVLAEQCRVIEPLQRKGSCDNPLTVKRHVTDLDTVIDMYCSGEKLMLAGHSWGAMLALAYAAVHPGKAASLALIGCGTFDPASREQMNVVRQERMAKHLFRRMQNRVESIHDPDERLKLMGKMMMQADSYRLMHVNDEVVYYDALGHEQTWRDMVRLQDEGIYPAAFKAICASVLMLHGSYDPHPGEMIRDNLKSYIPQLEYRQWQQCGHYPWLEKAAYEEFYSVLIQRILHTVALS